MAGQSSKGNPASHRMGNPKLRERRARSWMNGQTRKIARRRANDAAFAANQVLRANGLMTAWEQACQNRRLRRHPESV